MSVTALLFYIARRILADRSLLTSHIKAIFILLVGFWMQFIIQVVLVSTTIINPLSADATFVVHIVLTVGVILVSLTPFYLWYSLLRNGGMRKEEIPDG